MGFEQVVLVLGGVLVGVMRAGFGGGVGVVAAPVLALVMPAKTALGVILPLVLVADFVSGRYYWGHWVIRHLYIMLPGIVVGVALGGVLLNVIPEDWFRRVLGFMACFFALLQVCRDRLPQSGRPPGRWVGIGAGVALGLVSALLHAGGVVMMLYLLPQGLSGRPFVATAWVLGAILSLLKLVPYLMLGLIQEETLMQDVWMLPTVALGAFVGIWLNRRLSAAWFNRAILAIVLVIGMKLVFF